MKTAGATLETARRHDSQAELENTMKNLIIMTCTAFALSASAIGCGASAAEEQRRAVIHQNNADQAAQQGQYGIASDEQRKAEEAHAKAVRKAMDEGKAIPRQTRPGDPAPTRPQQ